MRKIKVACSPLTNVIYAGATTKGGAMLGANKQDVTMECLIAVIEHVIKNGSTVGICKQDGAVDFEIEVRDLRALDVAGERNK